MHIINKETKVMDDYIKEISNSLDFDTNSLVKVNDNLYLTKKEIDVLKRYDINYETCKDLNMLLYLIDECLNNCYTEEDLENISIDISERNYYMNTNK